MLNIHLKLNTTRLCQLNGSEKLVYLIQLMNEILTVLQADYVNDYTLIIHFSNGEKRAFDFSSLFDRGICHKLKDEAYFKNYRIDPFTVDWNNEIAFAPEFLYEQGVPYQA